MTFILPKIIHKPQKTLSIPKAVHYYQQKAKTLYS